MMKSLHLLLLAATVVGGCSRSSPAPPAKRTFVVLWLPAHGYMPVDARITGLAKWEPADPQRLLEAVMQCGQRRFIVAGGDALGVNSVYFPSSSNDRERVTCVRKAVGFAFNANHSLDFDKALDAEPQGPEISPY